MTDFVVQSVPQCSVTAFGEFLIAVTWCRAGLNGGIRPGVAALCPLAGSFWSLCTFDEVLVVL